MRRILIVLLMLIAGVAHARILHVGDNTIKLSQTKTTTPALHVRVGDEVWYGNMTRCPMPMNENTDKKLRVRYNDTDYYVSDVSDYVIVDNKLIAANCNIYLESTGTQWIDTLFLPTEKSKFISTLQLVGKINVSLFGCEATPLSNFNRVQFFVGTKAVYSFRMPDGGLGYDSAIDAHDKVFVIYDIKNKMFNIDNRYFINHDFVMPVFENSLTLYGQKYSVSSIRTLSQSKFYNFIIYEDDVLVRHFVPVPRGLVIGDFVVPENGMWDIVEQKFYGNMGTGEFIYGVD